MATTTPPAISGLPAAPDPNDRSTFNTRAYPWSAALPTLSTEIAAVAANVKANADDAKVNADIAVAQVPLATAQVALATAQAGLSQQAAASAGSIAWLSGTNYSVGDLRYSPIDFQTYRRKTAGAGTTDPSADSVGWVIQDSLPSKMGNSGKYLTTNGSEASWGSAPVYALTLLATLTPTVAANLDALSIFSGTYDNYLIIGEGIRAATNDTLVARFAVGGSANTGASYFSPAGGTADASAANFMEIMGTPQIASGRGCNFSCEILNANDAANIKSAHVDSIVENSTNSFYSIQQGGVFVGVNAISGVRFYWSSGANFQASGKVRIYGYSNT